MPDGSSRRRFLKSAATGLVGAAMESGAQAPTDRPAAFQLQREREPASFASVPTGVTRTWLGRDFWANRLQDWRLHEGRLECLAGGEGDEVRTVAILTREIVEGKGAAHLRVELGPIEPVQGRGFAGFLVGAGRGELDYRAAALVQRASGVGGGILCVCESDGRLGFRDHTDEQYPLVFAPLPAEQFEGSAPPATGDIALYLDILPQANDQFEMRLSAFEPRSMRFLAGAIRRDVSEADLLGGILLVSSPASKGSRARYWFRDPRTSGGKVAEHHDRALGPVLGTLYSLNGNVLKLSAQLTPIGESEPRTVALSYREAASSGEWKSVSAKIEPGYTALFRVENWDSDRDWDYKVVYPATGSAGGAMPQHGWGGVIRKDPAAEDSINIGIFNCTIAAARLLEAAGAGAPEMPQAELLGRYTAKNLYFPHAELVKNAGTHSYDLLAFLGDQLYEGNPTRRDNSEAPTLDYLYKWYLWVLSFRELTGSTPSVVLVDDHDVYHGNVWGNGGRAAPGREQNRGGYRCTGEWVNIVQRTQCSHNPDAYDPTPVEQGITVYYGAFRYGGVSFAIIEDRKFKTAPLQGNDLDVHEAELLGARQEKFLEAWGQDWAGAAAKVCLTQTLWACVQTSPAGRPMLDFDANGYPKLARDRAIELVRAARALLVSGDQHLGTLVRHGLDTHTDAVVQFTAPAAGTSWQRWFEPARPLPNGTGQPHTGDFKDAFGNKVRVLAVANPKVSFREYRKHRQGRGQGLGDRRLKSEGYGVVRVDKKAREFVIECWPWNVDPAGGAQFPGWPYRLPFDRVASES